MARHTHPAKTSQKTEPLTLAAANAALFLLASAYAKIMAVSIGSPRDSTDRLMILTGGNLTLFADDIIAAAMVFSVVLAAAYALRHKERAMTVLVGITCISQFAYITYVAAGIEFLRYFKTPLTASFILMAPMLDKMLWAAAKTAVNSANTVLFLAEEAAAAWLSFWLMPRICRARIDTKRFVFLAAIFSVGVGLAAAGGLLFGHNIPYDVVAGKKVDENPLLSLVRSAYNRVQFFSSLERRPSSRPGTHPAPTGELYLEDDYPQMKATPYALCNSPLPGMRPELAAFCGFDGDGDGFDKTKDCDDSNSGINPAAAEIPYDGVDENCDNSDDPPLNVAMIVLESAQTDNLQLYGSSDEDTPNLMRFRNMSLVAYDFLPNSGDSSRGEILLYCSLYPYEDSENFDIDTYLHTPCIMDILKAHGYRSGYFAPYSDEWRGLKEFIESKRWDYTFDENMIEPGNYTRYTWGLEEKAMLPSFFKWVESDRKKPFFTVLRFSTGHQPFEYPKGYKVFDSDTHNCMLYADSFIGDLVDGLKDEGILNDTIVAIVSDHMLERYKNGRIPFIMINPMLFSGGRAAESQASQIDVAPTILGRLSIQSINSFEGYDMLSPGQRQSHVYFSDKSGLLKVYDGNYTFTYNIDKGEKTLENNGLDETRSNPAAADKYYSELLAWKGEQKQLYMEDRIFDKRIEPKSPPLKDESCWPLRNGQSGYKWAFNATASSNFHNDTNRLRGAVGSPDAAICSPSHNAWTPQEGMTKEWLEVYFENPAPAESLIVCESFAAPFIRRVELLDADGGYHEVWDDEHGDGEDRTQCNGRFELKFNRTDYVIKGARVHTFERQQEHIDAVGIM